MIGRKGATDAFVAAANYFVVVFVVVAFVVVVVVHAQGKAKGEGPASWGVLVQAGGQEEFRQEEGGREEGQKKGGALEDRPAVTWGRGAEEGEEEASSKEEPVVGVGVGWDGEGVAGEEREGEGEKGSVALWALKVSTKH